MKQLSNLSQNVRVFMAAVALSVGAAGCASGSDGTGTAGSGGTAGAGGGAGSTACALADVTTIFTSMATTHNHNCTTALACHDATGAAAGFDMATAGWQNKLVGMGPKAGAGSPTYPSMCATSGLKYLDVGSNPATGLFLDKINPGMAVPPCGVPMPEIYPRLSATEFACVQSWATTLTNP
jgi:hypothetical protein